MSVCNLISKYKKELDRKWSGFFVLLFWERDWNVLSLLNIKCKDMRTMECRDVGKIFAMY